MSTHFLNGLTMEGNDWALVFLFITLFFEFTTGITKAIVFHRLKSSTGLLGVFKHMIILTPFLFLFLYALAVPSPTIDFGFFKTETGDAFAYLFYVVYILSLWVSIAENLDALGVPLPKFVTKILYDTNNTLKNGSAKEVAELGSKALKTVSDPTKAVHELLDDKEENKDDLSESKPTEYNQSQHTKKDPQEAPDKVNKPNRLN
ncbi:phage holin family protein [Holzapfeliella sp. JNUCC 80]